MMSRSKLQWRCRRGMLELDLLLEGFLMREFEQLLASERSAFEQLLTYSDQLLLEYLLGRERPVDEKLAHVVGKIRAAAQA